MAYVATIDNRRGHVSALRFKGVRRVPIVGEDGALVGIVAVVDLVASDATIATCHHLLDLPRSLLAAGYRFIVDATFLKQHDRRLFRQLAKELSVPFAPTSMPQPTNYGEESFRGPATVLMLPKPRWRFSGASCSIGSQ